MVPDEHGFAWVPNEHEITVVRFPSREAELLRFTQHEGKHHHGAEGEQAKWAGESHESATSTTALYFRPS